jgi:hypothetical protein
VSGPFATGWDAAKFAGGIASPEAVPAAITWMRQGIPPAIIAGSVVLTPRQVGTVLLALRDAMDHRTGRLLACRGCDAAEIAGDPTTACARHEPDFDQGTEYNELSELLGGGLIAT